MEIFKRFTLEAAHRLPNVPDGHKCARVHGHSFQVELRVSGDPGAHSGWVMDFADLKAAFAPLHDAMLTGYTLTSITWPVVLGVALLRAKEPGSSNVTAGAPLGSQLARAR